MDEDGDTMSCLLEEDVKKLRKILINCKANDG